MKINLNIFKNEIYEKLSEVELNELFYWSLFDPSFSEDMTKRFKLPLSSRKKFVLSKLKMCSSIAKECEKGKKEEDLFIKDLPSVNF